MAGLYAPLPTLRRRPRGRLRTDRGRRGLLLLHRSGLSPHTPCQSPGALTCVVPERELTVCILANASDGWAGYWVEGALHILRRFATRGAPSEKVRDWAGRWWTLWGA